MVDEEFGVDVAGSARRAGFGLAMPVERSGEDLGRHVEAFDPTTRRCACATARQRRRAQPHDGYTAGFAIGRSLWPEALTEQLAGRLGRDVAADRIAANYRRMIDVYANAAGR